jgi:hypothetical protein
MKSRRRETRAGKIGVAIFLIASCAWSAGALAQAGAKTWRCGSSYGDQPCEGGRALKVDDTRSEADRRAAEASTVRAEKRADQLERIRLSQEKEALERDRRAAQDARRATLDDRRLASSEQLTRARVRKMDTEPHKSSARFHGASDAKGASASGSGDRKKKRKSSGSDAG